MTEGVVELLEVVDVDHEQGQRLLEALGAGHLGREALLEEAVVVEAGEAVGARLLFELAVGALQLDVAGRLAGEHLDQPYEVVGGPLAVEGIVGLDVADELVLLAEHGHEQRVELVPLALRPLADELFARQEEVLLVGPGVLEVIDEVRLRDDPRRTDQAVDHAGGDRGGGVVFVDLGRAAEGLDRPEELVLRRRRGRSPTG